MEQNPKGRGTQTAGKEEGGMGGTAGNGKPFSEMINLPDLKTLLNLFKVSEKKRDELTTTIIRAIGETESALVHKSTYRSRNMFDECKQNLYNRYTNPNWERLSKSFDETWDLFNLDSTVLEVLL